MKGKGTNIRISLETRDKYRLLSALKGKPMSYIADELAEKELLRLKEEGDGFVPITIKEGGKE